jgi:hypothetical protein
MQTLHILSYTSPPSEIHHAWDQNKAGSEVTWLPTVVRQKNTVMSLQNPEPSMNDCRWGPAAIYQNRPNNPTSQPSVLLARSFMTPIIMRQKCMVMSSTGPKTKNDRSVCLLNCWWSWILSPKELITTFYFLTALEAFRLIYLTNDQSPLQYDGNLEMWECKQSRQKPNNSWHKGLWMIIVNQKIQC